MSASTSIASIIAASKEKRVRRGFKPSAEPNVIPFIDVLLVLLIIFMVTAPKPTVDHKVDLPNAPSGPVIGIEPTIVTLRDMGGVLEVSVGVEVVPFEALGGATLAHALANNPRLETNDIYAEARIYVRADQNTAYGNVVAVMDVLQSDGFAQVGIFAETADEG